MDALDRDIIRRLGGALFQRGAGPFRGIGHTRHHRSQTCRAFGMPGSVVALHPRIGQEQNLIHSTIMGDSLATVRVANRRAKRVRDHVEHQSVDRPESGEARRRTMLSRSRERKAQRRTAFPRLRSALDLRSYFYLMRSTA